MLKNTLKILIIILVTTVYSYANNNDDCEITLTNINSTSQSDTTITDNQFIVNSSCELSQYKITIYSRWGEAIYQSDNIYSIIDLNKIENDVYIYFIEVQYLNGTKGSDKGNIVIKGNTTSN